MVQGILQECCHLLCHRQPLIVFYTDPVLPSLHNHNETRELSAFVTSKISSRKS